MNEQKPNPGEGWRLFDPIMEPFQEGDEFLSQHNAGWIAVNPRQFGSRLDSTDYIHRRRIPAPAGGWLCLATTQVPPDTSFWVGNVHNKTVACWQKGCWRSSPVECGWTHWQLAIVPDPPKAPKLVKSAEEVAFSEWSKESWLELNANQDALRVWNAALAWRKANP